MGGLLGTLQIGKRGVMTHRYGMDIVAHNISNAKTEGYSRQRVNLTAAKSAIIHNQRVGQGVEVLDVERLRDNLIDRQVRYTKSNLGYNETKAYYRSKIEGLFPEPSDYGLQAYFGNFFSELRNVTNNPQDLAVRNTFMQSAVTLASGFQSTADNVFQLQEDLTKDVTEKIGTVNEILKDVHELNTLISIEQGAQMAANDLLDKRDVKLDELSQYLNIQIVHLNDGVAQVSTSGMALVSKNSVQELSKSSVLRDGKEINIIQVDKTKQEVPISSGQLLGAVEVLNNDIPSVQEQLNTLANTFITEINQLHAASYTLRTPSQAEFTGVELFAGNTAGSISVNPNVQNDVTRISISSNGDPGDSEGGLSLLNLETAPLIENKYSINQYYGFLVSEVGLNTNNSTVAAEGNVVSLATFEGDRDSVTGVSVDEELTELIQVQRAFQASSKIISTVDKLLENIINFI